MLQMEALLSEILNELREINQKLDDIKGFGPWDSITDICDKLDAIDSNTSGL